MYEFIQLISVLLDEVTFGTWYSDVLVPVDSQQGVSGSKNYYFTKFIKEYNNDNTSLTPKLATNNVPVIHNLEPYDPDIHNYILENIIMKSGDTLNTEISNVGILGEYHESSDTRSVSGW